MCFLSMESYVNVMSKTGIPMTVSPWKKDVVNRTSSGHPEMEVKHFLH